jgi:hypothetical protein
VVAPLFTEWALYAAVLRTLEFAVSEPISGMHRDGFFVVREIRAEHWKST